MSFDYKRWWAKTLPYIRVQEWIVQNRTLSTLLDPPPVDVTDVDSHIAFIESAPATDFFMCQVGSYFASYFTEQNEWLANNQAEARRIIAALRRHFGTYVLDVRESYHTGRLVLICIGTTDDEVPSKTRLNWYVQQMGDCSHATGRFDDRDLMDELMGDSAFYEPTHVELDDLLEVVHSEPFVRPWMAPEIRLRKIQLRTATVDDLLAAIDDNLMNEEELAWAFVKCAKRWNLMAVRSPQVHEFVLKLRTRFGSFIWKCEVGTIMDYLGDKASQVGVGVQEKLLVGRYKHLYGAFKKLGMLHKDDLNSFAFLRLVMQEPSCSVTTARLVIPDDPISLSPMLDDIVATAMHPDRVAGLIRKYGLRETMDNL